MTVDDLNRHVRPIVRTRHKRDMTRRSIKIHSPEIRQHALAGHTLTRLLNIANGVAHRQHVVVA